MGIINTAINWYKILKINSLDSDFIANIQEQRMRRLLRHALANSEFYHEAFKGIDLEKCSLQDLPSVTKAAMMDNYDRFVTDKRIKLNEIRRWVEIKKNDNQLYLGEFYPFLTSGSTGVNALVAYHRREVDVIQASQFAFYPFLPERSKYDRIKTTAGYLFGQRPRIAAILVSRGNIYQFFKRVPWIHRLFINLRMFSLMDGPEKIVSELNKFRPDQLISNSFFIALLAQEQIAGRLNITFNHPMSFISGFGELLTEHTQELASKAWNLKIQNTYGSMESYVMATSCREYDRLHLLSFLCIVEIVDRHYNPVPPGQYGEKILLTNLFNYTQPIIRYEIDDVIGYAEHDCGCGSPFPALLPMQGRAKDIFYFRNRRGGYDQFPPNALTIALMYVHELRQYQIVQTARNKLTINYVPQNDVSDIELNLKEELIKALAQKGLENIVALKFKQVESIPRDKRSGKYIPMISLGVPANLNTN